jgi:hypothetical protein
MMNRSYRKPKVARVPGERTMRSLAAMVVGLIGTFVLAEDKVPTIKEIMAIERSGLGRDPKTDERIYGNGRGP